MSSINSINPTHTGNDPSRDIESTSKGSKEITVIRSDNGSAKHSFIRSIWNKTIVMKIYSFLGVKDLMNVRVLTKMSKYLAILTLRNRAKEVFPDLAQVEGLVSPGLIITRRDQVHEIAEAVQKDFPESFKTLLAQEKSNPTIEGTKQLKDYLDYRSILVVWQKLADAIGVEDKPDLLELSSFEAFKKKSSEFSKWFEDNSENLKNLPKLELDSNHLISLPQEIGKLNSLTSLTLDKNHLNSLPKEVANLISLQSLSLQNNPLKSLPKEIGKLTSLEWLVLSKIQLQSLPQEIRNLPNCQIVKYVEILSYPYGSTK